MCKMIKNSDRAKTNKNKQNKAKQKPQIKTN